jgi:hypothetical protein
VAAHLLRHQHDLRHERERLIKVREAKVLWMASRSSASLHPASCAGAPRRASAISFPAIAAPIPRRQPRTWSSGVRIKSAALDQQRQRGGRLARRAISRGDEQ